MNNPVITKACLEDLEEILQLQYLAYQSEAALFGSNDIPPLKQTIDEVVEEYHKGRIFVKQSEVGKGTTFRIEIKK